MAALLLAFLASAALAAPSYPDFSTTGSSTAPITVIWPPEGLPIGAASGEFILGSIAIPTATFKINGRVTPTTPKGAFLAWHEVKPGTFTFNLTLEAAGYATSYARSVLIAQDPPVLPEKPLTIDPDSLFPRIEQELGPGDVFVARMRASPKAEARFKIGGSGWRPMAESGRAPGHYEGVYAVRPGDESSAEPVEYKLGSGWGAAEAKSQGKAALVSAAPRVGVVKPGANISVKTAPDAGYVLFPLPGTRLAVVGRAGAAWKVRLSPDLAGWIDAKDVELQPAGVVPPRVVVGTMRTKASENGASLRIGLPERVPFTVEESADLRALTLRLFYASSHTNWIVYDSADKFVQEARFKQESSDVVAVTILLKERVWGYEASYEPGELVLDVRRAPRLPPEGSVLKGLAVMLDPGHMPSGIGATGPLGTKEMDLNFAIAKSVEARLAKAGANPLMTRDHNMHEVSLVDRPKLAAERKADVFISLHNNGLPDGANPFARPRGFMVFYFHPHSMALARETYRSFERNITSLPGEELRFGNLLVARLTAVPAILVECASLIIPEQEEKLLDSAFRESLAVAVVDGLRGYLEEERRLQNVKSPVAAAKAGPAAEVKKRAKKT